MGNFWKTLHRHTSIITSQRRTIMPEIAMHILSILISEIGLGDLSFYLFVYGIEFGYETSIHLNILSLIGY